MNNIDPNWFFSATAQSFAAIVAIIGGFILSRFLSLSMNKRSFESKVKELEIKKNNKEFHYKLQIREWKEIIESSLFDNKRDLLQSMNQNFENELKEKINQIDLISHYKSFEEIYKEIILLIYKIMAVSIEIIHKNKIGIPYGNLNVIKEHICYYKIDLITIFDKWNLDFNQYVEKVARYIWSEMRGHANLDPQSTILKECQEIYESKIKLEEAYTSIKIYYKNSDSRIKFFIDTETILENLWEELQNLKDEKSQYKREIQVIDEDESLKKVKKPLLLLFIFGVIFPLCLLIIVSILKNVLCVYHYWAFYLLTIVGIGYALRETYKYFRTYLKF